MYDLYEGQLSIDFYSTEDLESRMYRFLTGFSSPHVGLGLYSHYLISPGEGRKMGWYPRNTIERLMGNTRTASFTIYTDNLDGGAIALLGDGHVVSPKHVRIYNEIVNFYRLPLPTPKTTTCVGVVSSILRMVGLPIRGRTAKELHDELRYAADLCGSRCMVEEDVSANHQHTRN